MFVPDNVDDFYTRIEKNKLYQGDILNARIIGLKKENSKYSPDYWMIITKSCDLVIEEDFKKTRKGNISVIPLLKLFLLPSRFRKYLDIIYSNFLKKIVIVPLINIFKNSAVKKKNIDSLVRGKITRFFFLPPDGNVLSSPMIIDFDIIKNMDATDETIFRNVLKAKEAQLSSPFREKIAQHFALHFASIGINDQYIRDKKYINRIKENLK